MYYIKIIEFLKNLKEIYLLLVFLFPVFIGIVTGTFSFFRHKKNKILKKEGIRELQ